MRIMEPHDPERLKKMLVENRVKRRASALVEHWASHGVSVSPVAHGAYRLLTDRLRGGRSWPLRWTSDLLGELRSFVAATDMVAIIGWDVEEEPALLVSVDKVAANVSALDHIYPDGFVLISDAAGRALLVDFADEEGTHVNIVDLPKASR